MIRLGLTNPVTGSFHLSNASAPVISPLTRFIFGC
jgi:hypothetical protein